MVKRGLRFGFAYPDYFEGEADVRMRRLIRPKAAARNVQVLS